jgi:UDP-N-acetylmuramate dehydrogenase
MNIHTNIPLKNYTTMKLGGNTRFMADVQTPDEVATVCRNAKAQSLRIFILGGGSNVIANDNGFDGIIIHIRIPGFEIVADDILSTTIRIGAGENWDSVVKRTVDMNLSGIEAMSYIPGTAGATPVQNVGAYGQEIADTLQSLTAYDIQNDSFVTLTRSDCDFKYRSSIFRDRFASRYVITSIDLKLSKNIPTPPFYNTLQKYLDEHNITVFNQKIIRDAVIEIRKNKLPDPKTKPNTGSFFKNAIIEKWQIDIIKSSNPDVSAFEMSDGRYKIPSGWLIEQAGLKGQLISGIRVYENNSLVLVNESAVSYTELANARDRIISEVYDKFRIQIEQEPVEI